MIAQPTFACFGGMSAFLGGERTSVVVLTVSGNGPELTFSSSTGGPLIVQEPDIDRDTNDVLLYLLQTTAYDCARRTGLLLRTATSWCKFRNLGVSLNSHKPGFSPRGRPFGGRMRTTVPTVTPQEEMAQRHLVREEPMPLLRVLAGSFALAPATAGGGFADWPALNTADAWLE